MSLFFVFFYAVTACSLLIPNPKGPYPVTMGVHSLTDTSRMDPFAPSDKPHHRRILVSVFQPILDMKGKNCTEEIPYMTPAVAEEYGTVAASVGLPNTTFGAFQLHNCPASRQKWRSCLGRHSKSPVVVFSPGFGMSRLLYGVMARSLASNGLAVATIDHPYDANVVEFPDGRVIRAANLTEDEKTLEMVVQVRAADISFAIDQFHTQNSFSSLRKHHQLEDIVAYGHSLGGCAAAETARRDQRVQGGINLDGQLVNPVKTKGLNKPFLLAGRPDHEVVDATWPEFWSNLRGSKAELAIAGTQHGSYTDLPLLVSLLGLPDSAKKILEGQIGSIDAKRLDDILNASVLGFAKLVYGTESAALEGLEEKFDEVRIVDADFPGKAGR